MDIINRLICLCRGHQYSAKTILALKYASCSIETCDRCGEGERDLQIARKQAAPYVKATPATAL